MFISVPDYKFRIPEGLGQTDATYWRALGISTNAAWFVISLRERHPEALPDTMVLAWDRDVVDVIKSSEADVESVLVVAPHVRGRKRGWYSKQIMEIWEGTDPDDGNPCVLMVDEQGGESAGIFMNSVTGVERGPLVARVKTPGSRGRKRANT